MSPLDKVFYYTFSVLNVSNRFENGTIADKCSATAAAMALHMIYVIGIIVLLLEKFSGIRLANVTNFKQYEPVPFLLFLIICGLPYLYYSALGRGEKIINKIISEKGMPTEKDRNIGAATFVVPLIVVFALLFSTISSQH
jgi:hypothetical protein